MAFKEVTPGVFYRVCGKCGGTGDHWAKHVWAGRCFTCLGNGVVGKARDAKKVAQLEAAAEKRLAKAAAEAEAKAAKWMAENAERLAAEAAAEQAAAAAREARLAEFQWVGTEGEPIEFAGEVTFVKYIEPYAFGRSATRLVVVKVPEGEVKFFSAAAWVWDLEVGQQVAVKATVKAHEEYEGKKATMVARPKALVNA